MEETVLYIFYLPVPMLLETQVEVNKLLDKDIFIRNIKIEI